MYLKALKREKYAKFRGNLKKCTRVYDKKLLWRANLYIDEGEATDWNNLNRWNDSVNNKWWDINADVPGGQITIKPWTLPYHENEEYFDSYTDNLGNPIKTINNAVAYSWGGCDRPNDFNLDLTEQQNCLNISLANGWTSTLAPNDDWNDYDYQIRTGNNPYRPAYTTILARATNLNNFDNVNSGGYEAPLTSQSSGVDCYGLIQRAASYSGNNYTVRDVRWGGSTTENRLEWDQYTSGIKIDIFGSGTGFYDNSWLVYNATTRAGNINLIVPGDIITMNGHIALVKKVILSSGNSRIIDIANVYTIEATSPRDQWQVLSQDDRNLGWLAAQSWAIENGRNVEVRRLKTN